MLGILDKHNAGGANKEKGRGKSTRKDLQRLNRYDLLELLVDQMHEGDELRLTIANGETKIVELTSLVERLKDKLNLKDEQIEHLKRRLDDKDTYIARLKKRLDDKDMLITRLSSGEIIDPEVLEVLEARERAAELEEAAAEEAEVASFELSELEDDASEPVTEL